MSNDRIEKLAQEMANTLFQFRKIQWSNCDIDGVRKSEFVTLMHIVKSEEKDGIKISELSNRMQITPAAVTHMINSLEEGGYIRRCSDKNDRRVVKIKATNKGIVLTEKMETKLFEKLCGLVEYLGEDKSKEFIGYLERVIEYFKEKN